MPSSNKFVSFPDLLDPARSHLYQRAPVEWLHAKILHYGAVRLSNDWVSSYMSDPQWRLYCNLDSGCRVYVDEEPYELKAGEIYVLPAWMRWRGSVQQPFRHMFLGVDIPQFSQVQTRRHWPRPMHIPDTADIREDWIVQSQRLTDGTLREAHDFAHMYVLMYRILEKTFALSPPPELGIPSELSDICSYIDEHLAADLNNERLAELAHCSSGHLIRLFQKLMSQSPANYVRERRLSVAANRLAYTDDSIESITDELGFPNRHYFSRVFHKMMGYPPAAYRKLFRLQPKT